MSRPALNAARQQGTRALAKLPPPPKSMPKDQVQVYARYGQLLVDAGTLAATDLPMIESAARVRATLDELYADESSSAATIAALERLHKEQLVQLGLTPAARRAVQKLEAPLDAEERRLKNLLE